MLCHILTPTLVSVQLANILADFLTADTLAGAPEWTPEPEADAWVTQPGSGSFPVNMNGEGLNTPSEDYRGQFDDWEYSKQ